MYVCMNIYILETTLKGNRRQYIVVYTHMIYRYGVRLLATCHLKHSPRGPMTLIAERTRFVAFMYFPFLY